MRYSQFIKTDTAVLHIDDISAVDCSRLESDILVIVTQKTQPGNTVVQYVATNLNAIELLMQIRPSALEGKRLKWARHVWSLHNLVAHPLMQICAFFRFYKLAFWLHDVTVPKPLPPKKNSV